jgi:hypothetical protein
LPSSSSLSFNYIAAASAAISMTVTPLQHAILVAAGIYQ